MLIHGLLVSRLTGEALVQLEVLMQKRAYAWKREFARTLRAQGREAALQGLQEGLWQRRRVALLMVLERRGLALSPEHRVRIAECEDTYELERWLRRARTVAAATAIFDSDAVEGLTYALLVLLERRGLALSSEHRLRIAACKDADVIVEWIRRGAVATTASEVFDSGAPLR